MFRSNRLLVLPLLLFLTAAPAVWAQGEKSTYKLGLVLDEDKKDKRYDSDVLNAATEAFVASKRFTMVERKHLNAIFTEKDLQEFIGGQVNNKLFDVLGLDLLGAVSYTLETKQDSQGKPVKNWIIDVRVMDVRTAMIVATITSNRPNFLEPLTPREAGERLFRSIRDVFPPLGNVIEIRDKKKVVVNLGSDAGLKKGDSLEIVHQGDQIVDELTGKVYSPPLEVVGKLSVHEIGPQTSICKVKSSKGEITSTSLVRLQVTDSRIVKWLLMVPRVKNEWQEKRKEFEKDDKNKS